MRDLTPELLSHLASGGTKLTACWRLERKDGSVLRSTQHDRDLSVSVGSPDRFDLTGIYSAARGITGSNIKSSSDLSVSNLEVNGSLKDSDSPDFTFDDISQEDLESGLFDNALYTIFQVNWADPSGGVIILMRGTLGNIRRDSDGAWTCELRSLAQALSQVQGRSYGVLCDATLGDARCGVNLEDYTFTGIVDAVTSARVFSALIDAGSPEPDASFFQYGLLTFTSGANAGFSREVASASLTDIELFESFPAAPADGDTFEISAGCNKELNIEVIDGQDEPPSVANGRVTGDCEVKFGNGPNFRGFPNKPGPDTMVRLRTPSRKSGGGGGKK